MVSVESIPSDIAGIEEFILLGGQIRMYVDFTNEDLKGTKFPDSPNPTEGTGDADTTLDDRLVMITNVRPVYERAETGTDYPTGTVWSYGALHQAFYITCHPTINLLIFLRKRAALDTNGFLPTYQYRFELQNKAGQTADIEVDAKLVNRDGDLPVIRPGEPATYNFMLRVVNRTEPAPVFA